MSVLLALGVAATLFLAEDGTPTIRYAPDHPGRFVDSTDFTHSVARTKFWSYDAKCLALEARRFSRASPDCGPAEFRLSWDELSRDRIYPGVVRLRNGGSLVFTRYLQPFGEDGRLVPWEARAPQGGVVAFRGEKTTSAIELGARYFSRDGRGYVYLGPDRFREERAGRVMVDDGVPAAIEREMLEVAPRLMALFESRLGTRPAERPSLYLTWVQREGPGREVQADVVPGAVIRFGLSGAGWSDGSPAALGVFRLLVAHELVHLWNTEVVAPASWAAPWVAEGNAELLGVAGLLGLGLVDAAAATQRVANAFNECVLLTGARPWVGNPGRHHGKIPYACGMAIQFGALAAASRAGPVDAFALWKSVWSATPRYYEAALTQELERRGLHAAAAQLQRMLIDADAAFGPALQEFYREAGVRLAPVDEPDESLRGALRGQTLMALMQSDCKGAYGFYARADHYFTDGDGCANFRPQMKVRYLEGADMFAATADALAAVRRACGTRKHARVATMEGQEWTVACDAAALPGLAGLVALDPAQVAALLHRGPANISSRGM